MAYTTLKTDYANDVLNEAVNTNVKYVLTDNGDNTISLQDATDIGVLQDGKIDLDIYASAGTTDGDLTAALTALGWLSDVIE